MYERPGYSPWGSIQHEHKLCPGVYTVSIAGHGGIMATAEMAKAVFSEAALKCSFRHNGFVCFEEDCDAPVALRELLDKKLIDGFFDYKAAELGEILDRSLKQWHPEYWKAREKAMEKGQPAAPQPQIKGEAR